MKMVFEPSLVFLTLFVILHFICILHLIYPQTINGVLLKMLDRYAKSIMKEPSNSVKSEFRTTDLLTGYSYS